MTGNGEPWALAPAVDTRDWAARFPLVTMPSCWYCREPTAQGRPAFGGDAHVCCPGCRARRAAFRKGSGR